MPEPARGTDNARGEEHAERRVAERRGEERSVLLPRPPERATMRIFDAIWSDQAAAPAEHQADADAAAPSRHEAAPMSAPGGGPVPAAGSDEVRIFKAGVIEGMAYTLYTDGSIEAELAEGPMRFSSLADLRAYLATRER